MTLSEGGSPLWSRPTPFERGSMAHKPDQPEVQKTRLIRKDRLSYPVGLIEYPDLKALCRGAVAA
jgi:hypothetical protein